VRYYVLERPDPISGSVAYILAEVVKDQADDGRYRDSSAASNVSGGTSRVLTREELLAEPGGVAALRAWEQGDDSTYDQEIDDGLERIDEQESRKSGARASRHLRLVDDRSSRSGNEDPKD
jgi:hypothetical protein